MLKQLPSEGLDASENLIPMYLQCGRLYYPCRIMPSSVMSEEAWAETHFEVFNIHAFQPVKFSVFIHCNIRYLQLWQLQSQQMKSVLGCNEKLEKISTLCIVQVADGTRLKPPGRLHWVYRMTRQVFLLTVPKENCKDLLKVKVKFRSDPTT